MNTLIELANAYATCCWSDGANDMEHPNTDKARAALVAGIEALQSESENWQKANRAISVLNKSLAAERDSLQSQLDDYTVMMTSKCDALQAEVERLKADYLEVERLCDATYVAKGADAYNHACDEMERFQEQRREAGKEVGTERSLCDGMAWLYGHVSKVEAERDALRAELATLKGAEPVLVVEKEPDYWSGGHFHQGTKCHLDLTKVWKLPVGTKLYAGAAPQAPAPAPLTDEKMDKLYRQSALQDQINGITEA
jgi:hypothetical protein